MRKHDRILVDPAFKVYLKVKAAEMGVSIVDLTRNLAKKNEFDDFSIEFNSRIDGFKRKKNDKVFKL